MWSQEQWRDFLSTKCTNYPVDDIEKDSQYLHDERIQPCIFDDLIEMFDSDVSQLSQCLPKLAFGNLIKLVKAMRESVKVESTIIPKREEYTFLSESFMEQSSQEMLLSLDSHLVKTSHLNQFNELQKKLYYYTTKNDPTTRRCVVVFSPKYAVIINREGLHDKIESSGIFKVFSFDVDEKGKSREEIDVYVRFVKNEIVIMTTLLGFPFVESSKEHFMNVPSIGTQFVLFGLSPSLEPFSIEGKVIETEPESIKRTMMVADCDDWEDDSGGAIFDSENRLIGIAYRSAENTQPAFIHAGTIFETWEETKNPKWWYEPEE